ncbi:MAG: tRNA (adenosine(37)-N6)-dimethylallyltransferase MiaA, partial [Cetobacterium sp.]
KYLYERIDMRVDLMVENGLLEEVKYLYKKYGDILKKINIIGYTEIISYLNNEITMDEAKDLIKKNSRNYAKRQFTWFKNDQEYVWYDLDIMTQDEIILDILERFESL